MDKQTYVLGIDNGGTVSKAAVYALDGREIAVCGEKIAMRLPRPGFTERDMDELWLANVKVIRRAIERAGIAPEEIAGVAVTGHGNGMYLLGCDGRPVYPGIISTDTRAKAYVRRWSESGAAKRILPKTMQSIWAGQPTALLAWFKEHEPEVLEKTRHVMMCKDYIRYKLTGEVWAEITDLSGTGLMNVRDVCYDRELLEEYGLGDMLDKLAPIRYSAEVCGLVGEAAARETGLRAGTPVAGGLFDIDACAIASGITDEEKFCVVAGTWSINEYITKKPVVSKDLFMTSLYCMPGYWLALEGSPTSASNLEWFIDALLEERGAPREAAAIYERVNALVESAKPEESSIIFLPFLYGSNADANAKSCFIGVNGWHTKAHLLRAVYEGVVFSHKAHIDRLLAFRDPPRAVRIAGGAVKSRVWVQMFADCLGVPVELTASTELGALGAAICAGVATGRYASFKDAADSMVRVDYVCYPDAARGALYEAKYRNYRKAIASLSGLWKDLS